jgi:membrane-bound lytic murein transglycosylase A
MPLGATAPTDTSSQSVTFAPVAFADLPGWAQDDHLAAFETFLKSAGPVEANAASASAKTARPSSGLLAAGRAALGAAAPTTRGDARAFFETYFTAHRVVQDIAPGLLTGYYEPVLDGARTPGARFKTPVYRRPPDLVNLVAESERGALAHALTHARKTAAGVEPYATRTEIEEGALAGRGLEFLWLEDAVDTFFMHIQGSGRIRLPDGSMIRVSYDGKNGHSYTSIGRHLIDSGLFPADRMSLDTLKVWLKADPARARDVMRQNASFVFFRELVGKEVESPLGVLGIPLTTGRSLAVDTAFHAIGTPVYVSSPSLTHAPGQPSGFNRLMIAQDVGSAIRGPERGDIYFGSGDEAGSLAGITKHFGTYFVLLARTGRES